MDNDLPWWNGRWWLGGRVYFKLGGACYRWHLEIGRLVISWERKGEKW